MFIGLLPASLYTFHMGSANGTGPSGRILGRIQGATAEPDGCERLVAAVEEDFVDRDADWATTQVYNGLTLFAEGGGAGVSDDTAAGIGGIMGLSTSATQDHELTIKSGVAGILDGYEVFLEARLDLSPTSEAFIGLTAAGAPAGGVISTAGALAVAGFGILKRSSVDADGKDLDLVMFKAGGAQVVLAAGIGVATGSAQSFGFIYSMRESSSHGKCDVFIDNVNVAQIASADLPDATTPKNVPLAASITLQASAAAVISSDLDWFYCYSAMA